MIQNFIDERNIPTNIKNDRDFNFGFIQELDFLQFRGPALPRDFNLISS